MPPEKEKTERHAHKQETGRLGSGYGGDAPSYTEGILVERLAKWVEWANLKPEFKYQIGAAEIGAGAARQAVAANTNSGFIFMDLLLPLRPTLPRPRLACHSFQPSLFKLI
jgi:hypothetical protein